MTNKIKELQLKKLLSTAEQAYVEVKLKIHVAGVEAKKEWHGLQDQWLKFQHDCTCGIEQAKKSDVSIDDSLHVIGEEFMSAFQQIKDACNEEAIEATYQSIPPRLFAGHAEFATGQYELH